MFIEELDSIEKVIIFFNNFSNDLSKNIIKSLSNISFNLDLDLISLIKNLDLILSEIRLLLSILNVFKNAHEDKNIRDEASILLSKVILFQKNKILLNKSLYDKFISFKNSEEYILLNQEYRFFFDKQITEWRRFGLDLDISSRDLLNNIDENLNFYKYYYIENINSDQKRVTVNLYQLKSVPEDYVRSLPRDNNNLFNLRPDSLIEETAELESTRKKFWLLNNNIGYPDNLDTLNKIILLSDKKANLLGYASFSDFDISNQMAKSSENVSNFLDILVNKFHSKIESKIKDLKFNLAPNTQMVNGFLKPWDLYYNLYNYKNKIFNLNTNYINNYFIAKETIKRVLKIIQNLFAIEFIEIKGLNFWCDKSYVYQVKKNNIIKGFLILDLFHRKYKDSYVLEMPTINSTKNIKGLSIIMANFYENLNLIDVSNLFHEIGHSIHTLLGETELISIAGTKTKRDFSEMPSQLLEIFLYRADVLKEISCNEKGESLSDKIINNIIKSKEFESDFLDLEQALYAKVSLKLFDSGSNKNIPKLYKRLYKETLFLLEYNNKDHFYLSFDHLISYGAKYYSYLWSKKIALDIYEEIKDLNTKKIQVYIDKIILKGGSKDPQELLEEFKSQV